MERYFKEIDGVEVLLVRVGNNWGWFCDVEGRECHDYVILPDSNEIDNKENVFEVLERQAQNIIEDIKVGNKI